MEMDIVQHERLMLRNKPYSGISIQRSHREGQNLLCRKPNLQLTSSQEKTSQISGHMANFYLHVTIINFYVFLIEFHQDFR